MWLQFQKATAHRGEEGVPWRPALLGNQGVKELLVAWHLKRSRDLGPEVRLGYNPLRPSRYHPLPLSRPKCPTASQKWEPQEDIGRSKHNPGPSVLCCIYNLLEPEGKPR